MIKYAFVYIECIRIAYIYVHTCRCVLPPSHGLPCPGRHSCPLWRRLCSHLHLADRCSFCRNGSFHFVWSPLGKVQPRCAPSAASTHTPLLIRAEAADSLVCLPQRSVKGVRLQTGPRGWGTPSCSKLFQTDYYRCDYYYCCTVTSGQQCKQAHFKAK